MSKDNFIPITTTTITIKLLISNKLEYIRNEVQYESIKIKKIKK
jgi:hypothetical protein